MLDVAIVLEVGGSKAEVDSCVDEVCEVVSSGVPVLDTLNVGNTCVGTPVVRAVDVRKVAFVSIAELLPSWAAGVS